MGPTSHNRRSHGPPCDDALKSGWFCVLDSLFTFFKLMQNINMCVVLTFDCAAAATATTNEIEHTHTQLLLAEYGDFY